MSGAVDTFEDFAEWRHPRPAATVGDAMREFTGTALPQLLDWFGRYRALFGVAEPGEVAPLAPCVLCPRELPLGLRKYATVVAGLPLCIQHAEEAIKAIMFGVR